MRSRFLLVGLTVAWIASFVAYAGDVEGAQLDTDLRDEPRVKAAIERALAFLGPQDDQRLGAQALVARAHLFAGRRDHPSIVKAVEAVRFTIRIRPVAEPTLVYSLGLAIAFLTELDPVVYRPEIDGLVRLVLELQRKAGNWGYPNTPEVGDTSMTQYAVFGLWSASKAGIEVGEEVWIRAANWLIRTQDRGGGWGYQGSDPVTYELVRQREIRRSMTEAAMASLLLCGEQLRFFSFESDQLRVSRLLKPAHEQPSRPPSAGVERHRLDEALRRGVQWNETTREPIYSRFPYYHFYTVERFETFRRAALRESGGSEQWHRDGVEDLLRRQQSDGSWQGEEGSAPSTAFAVLFILRATRITLTKIEGLVAGTLVGGRGLPQPGGGVGRPQSRPGETVRRPNAQMADLVRQMDDPRFLASFQGVENVGVAQEKVEPEKMVKRLLELAGDDNPEAKAAALRALGRSQNLDDVPVMIEAIRDPNPAVYQAAVDALRRFDRRIADYGKTVPADDAFRAAEAAQWRQWYRTIRPTGR
jgi:hypothetical protein